MARTSLRVRMALISIVEHRARREPRKAAGELRAIFVEQIGRELVDRDDDEQLGRWRRLGGGLRREESRGCGDNELTHGAWRYSGRDDCFMTASPAAAR